MSATLQEIVDSYDPNAPLAEASTIPSAWYLDPRILDLERRTVFARSWQLAGRVDQVRTPGQYVSCELPAGEPVVVVRGRDDVLRGFYNVCRHHAAAVVNEPEGHATTLRCPYHGWTYSLDGQLIGTPDFASVCGFERSANGLVPLETAVWKKWIFVRLEQSGPSLEEFLGIEAVGLDSLCWMERRQYTVDCNWKVFVDNYLDGGYHVPHVHKGLDSVLDYSTYTIENGERVCLQSSPILSANGTDSVEPRIAAVRTGARAFYFWIYPNLMINAYEGAMDTNIVIPRAIDRTDVVFDYYFSDVSEQARQRNLASIAVSEQIQDEDVAICASVQRGLGSRAYTAGRLSVRREAGEHLFHRLLHEDLRAGLGT
jgi:phenylpropionate dioxygenase-like ring-hydroxylating dioxygenase large terminal subunit